MQPICRSLQEKVDATQRKLPLSLGSMLFQAFFFGRGAISQYDQYRMPPRLGDDADDDDERREERGRKGEERGREDKIRRPYNPCSGFAYLILRGYFRGTCAASYFAITQSKLFFFFFYHQLNCWTWLTGERERREREQECGKVEQGQANIWKRFIRSNQVQTRYHESLDMSQILPVFNIYICNTKQNHLVLLGLLVLPGANWSKIEANRCDYRVRLTVH